MGESTCAFSQVACHETMFISLRVMCSVSLEAMHLVIIRRLNLGKHA